MPTPLTDRLEALLGRPPSDLRPLSGGDIGTVMLAEFRDGDRLIVKQPGAGGTDTAEIEARMLRHLRQASDLPVPEVIRAEPGLLLIKYLDGASGLSGAAQADAGRHIAQLHGVTDTAFGLEFDTVIGPLHQPNPRESDWLVFFRDHRLLHMARHAHRRSRLPNAVLGRIERLAEKRLDGLVRPPARPELVHGDLWGGNILARDGRITGFIDPAIYYGHGEMDLAFITLFGTADARFFDAYREIRPIADGFFDARRDLYNLWPLLVHVALFGGSYLGGVERVLDRFGA